ncbi:EFR1 family ferrodoxin [Methanoculleus sp.]|uniref:EFR1 family ferrodoxin n=1 Tax=Methanoculleus sp. TaxID=90427 RepID=UPI0025D8388E|nr:EFR1 family ferrodoxin [Methanoculleus sp.]MCK9317766.1 EFR1 family ferrodoxin [Methanoculleus sp.]MDD2787676.1 EFR1 family ferrodoxin [Methanoculleus sp.]MDD3217120.1 EFR1 family ferrodoxin [Methanoculleus sp.]MDD4314655.1 EFR1 family ferrodoxin [Methanoculleus sp.]MDD4470571.1 EFR1 family ferrodoxin [Methanoculleus sp.]
MKTIIYYFTGTGNSLAAAKKIAGALGDCDIVPVASFADTPGPVASGANRVGLVCPVYFSGLPAMAASFAERLDLTAADYVFSVVTHGGGGGAAALRQLDGILREKAGKGLDAGFAVSMPGNYILMYASPAGEKRDQLLDAADTELDRIAGRIGQAERVNLPNSPVARIVRALMYPRFLSHVHENDRKFTVSEACTSCGTCAAVCPAGNIDIVGGRPVWNHRCELCCGCIHLCPAEAIQAGSRTEKRQRYRHPDLEIEDMENQREQRTPERAGAP